jgi:MFS superfamily sulfate permease-like transporter
MIFFLHTYYLLGGISSSYPAAGSFSRSSLNANAGARTPASKTTTIVVILLSLQYMTKTFQYIPQAALAAVIFASIFNLVSISDFWNAWKHNKKDFFTMLVTFTIVFVFNTGVGILAGVGCSCFVIIVESAFSYLNSPELEKEASTNFGVDVIKLNQDLNFLTLPRFLDLFTSVTLLKNQEPNLETASKNEKLFHKITSTLDYWLRPMLAKGVKEYPKAVVVDFNHVRIVDLSAMRALEDSARSARSKKIKVILINVTDAIAKSLIKFGIKNDSRELDDDNILTNLQVYLDQALNLPIIASASSDDVEEKKSEKYGAFTTITVAAKSERNLSKVAIELTNTYDQIDQNDLEK